MRSSGLNSGAVAIRFMISRSRVKRSSAARDVGSAARELESASMRSSSRSASLAASTCAPRGDRRAAPSRRTRRLVPRWRAGELPSSCSRATSSSPRATMKKLRAGSPCVRMRAPLGAPHELARSRAPPRSRRGCELAEQRDGRQHLGITDRGSATDLCRARGGAWTSAVAAQRPERQRLGLRGTSSPAGAGRAPRPTRRSHAQYSSASGAHQRSELRHRARSTP